MIEYSLPALKADGFAEKYAKHYLKKKQFEYDSGFYSEELLRDAYNKGFWAENYIQYLSGEYWDKMPDAFLTDYDYERLWPLNDWMRIWINDKLSLKYMLAGTEFDTVMPEYYFYMSQSGLRALVDNHNDNQTIEGFLKLLKEKKELACKPCNGQGAVGFHKLSYEGDYLLDGSIVGESGVENFVEQHKNCIYTEYMHPESSFAEISAKVPTIRIIVLNRSGNDPYIVPSAYIRFGTASQGESNYIGEKQKDDYSLTAGVNTKTGVFGNAKAFYRNKVLPLSEHPDNHVKIEGIIPNWNLMKETMIGISRFLFGVEWMGFDACVDDKGRVRIMEINSHPGIGYLQSFYPLLLDNIVREYIQVKLDKQDNLSEEEIERRNEILR